MSAASRREGRVELWKGRDPARDQSYFLYGTTADQLDFLRFPLGDLPKSEVRRLASEAGLIVANKPDSQDICFVPDGDYASLVKKLRPETAAPGDIVDARRRRARPATRAWSTSPSASAAGSRSAGRRSRSTSCASSPKRGASSSARAARWRSARRRSRGSTGSPRTRSTVEAKVRSMAPAGRRRSWDGARLTFANPEYGVAPGQSAVFYDGDRLLGGGTIVATEAAEHRRAPPPDASNKRIARLTAFRP